MKFGTRFAVMAVISASFVAPPVRATEEAESLVSPNGVTGGMAFNAAAVPDGPNTSLGLARGPLGPLAPTVSFRFPMRTGDWWTTTNYVDLDPGPGILDYGCYPVSYDGHGGNDIIIRDFVEMDEGRFALAAAPGTVVEVVDGNPDHNDGSQSTPANDVVVQHSDGSLAYYYHLAKWSTLVYTGQSIFEGQPVGLIGSSGNSTDPHLHFEVQQSGLVYEPGAGFCREGDSLWKAQLQHAFDNPVTVFDVGQTPAAPDGINTMKYRAPDVTHFRQTALSTQHYVWYKLADVHSADSSRVVWRRPNNTVYRDTGEYTPGAFYSYGWFWWVANLPASGSTGTWTVELYLNGVKERTLNFVFDGIAYQAPVATGRTIGVPKGTVKGALQGSDADGDIKGFTLASDPAHGEVKISGPRGRYFSYVPESGFAGTDTWQFKVVDGHGTSSANATMTMTVSPVVENALRLEGEDDHVAVPSSPSLAPPSFTLEAWIRRTTGSAGLQAIFDHRNPSASNAYGYSLFILPDSRLRATVGNGTVFSVAVGATRIPLDRWVHVAATYAGGALQLYVNGALDGTAAFPFSVNYAAVAELRVGGSFVPGESFRGEIEEARIWNVARDANELAQGASCAFFDSALPASVVGWWRFQGSAGDGSASANNGSLMAGASFLRTDSALPLTCLVQNLDGDSRADGLDNCPLDANDAQDDADADGLGDVCDLCPADPRPAQADSDRDGVGDPCDTCPFLGNTEQQDADGDGAGDLCDPAPSDGSVAVPSDQITLTLSHDKGTGVTALSWTPGAYAASYEVYRGSLTEVQARFYGTCQNARDGDTTDTTFAESQTPPAETAFYLLVVGVGPDGTRGLAGLDSDGHQRDLRAKDCN